MPGPAQTSLQFEGFTLDLARGSLRANDRDVGLRPKSFDVLRYLVEHPGRLVTKDEIAKAVWPNLIASDDSLNRCISEVRIALSDSDQRIIKTIPRRGYIFAGRLSRPAAPINLPFPDGPSIAVLPFTNRSSDPQQDYFVDGITEDLITSLSKFADLLVIAPHSAFRYRGTALNERQIGRELGVRYLLAGSVRRDGDRVRITAQLVDCETTLQLWAEHYDRELTGIFSVQDEVTQKIVSTLLAHISKSETERALAKRPEDFSAYDYCLRANALMKRWQADATGETIVIARSFYGQAVAADPNYAPPLHGLAMTFLAAWLHRRPHLQLMGEYQQPKILEHGLALAQKAVALDPNLPEARLTLANILRWLHRPSESSAEYGRAFEQNPNLVDYRYGLALIHWGRSEEGMEYLQRMMRLDPFHTPACLTFLGNAYYQNGQYTEAVETLRIAAQRLQTFCPTYVWLAASAAQLGYDREAQAAMTVALQLDPAFTIRWWLDVHQFVKPEDADRVAEGLRKARFPE
jgi:adenylate cyclase